MKSTKMHYLVLTILLIHMSCGYGDKDNYQSTTKKTGVPIPIANEHSVNRTTGVIIAYGVNDVDLIASEILWNEGKILAFLWNEGPGWKIWVKSEDADESFEILKHAITKGSLSMTFRLTNNPTD